MSSLLSLTPAAFARSLRDHGVRRVAFLLNENREWVSTLPAMERECQELKSSGNYQHEGVFIEASPTGELFSVGIQNTTRGQGCGGIRLWEYDTAGSLITDSMRLATGMGRKSALAGLWAGGGKGVIGREPETQAHRQTVFENFGEFVTSLQGLYVAAEDVGVTETDMLSVHARTRFATCIPADIGGSGNPSGPTARGVVCAMEGAVVHLGGDEGAPLAGKTVAMQGLGNVARFMVRELLSRDVKRIVACDVNPDHVALANKLFAAGGDSRLEARVCDPADKSILEEPCDVLALNALGGQLTDKTAPKVQAKIVCGAANNQLLEGHEDTLLKGIYVPDFLANRMGIVNCANEAFGYTGTVEDPSITRHYGREWSNSVFKITQTVLNTAKTQNISTNHAAEQLADQLLMEHHPIWPGRTESIRLGLIKDNWAQQ